MRLRGAIRRSTGLYALRPGACVVIIIIIIIRIYYGAAQPVPSSALQYNNVILDSGNYELIIQGY